MWQACMGSFCLRPWGWFRWHKGLWWFSLRTFITLQVSETAEDQGDGDFWSSSPAKWDPLSWHFRVCKVYSGSLLSWLRAIGAFAPLGFSCRLALVLSLPTWVWQCEQEFPEGWRATPLMGRFSCCNNCESQRYWSGSQSSAPGKALCSGVPCTSGSRRRSTVCVHDMVTLKSTWRPWHSVSK